MIQENTDIRSIYNHIKVLEARYRKNLESHLFFPLADAYVKADMLDQAEVILREGLSNHPKYCAARALLGELLFKKGNLQDAQQQLEEVVKIVPDNIMAHKLLIELYKRTGLQDRYERELKTLKMIDQEEERYSGIGQIETTITETYIERTKLNHKEGIETLEAEDSGVVSEEKKLIDFKGEKISETIRKNEAIREKEITVDKAENKQFGFFQKSVEEIDSASTKAFHEENKDEIITATLAELYFSQGFIEKSIEIYKKLLIKQPDQKNWAKRLVEIQEIHKNIKMDSEILPDRIIRSEAEDKKEKIMLTLEKWLENCQRLKK
jgi:tetratricopeptide (TPR) repeat protein